MRIAGHRGKLRRVADAALIAVDGADHPRRRYRRRDEHRDVVLGEHCVDAIAAGEALRQRARGAVFGVIEALRCLGLLEQVLAE
jgi:hypothetical protein